MNGLNEISFKELNNFNDSNSVVLTSVSFDEMTKEEIISEINEIFHNVGLIKEDKNVIDVKYINDNVLGEDSRPDYLIIFDNEKSLTSPMARLQMASSVKWTSDFIDNYKTDYISGK